MPGSLPAVILHAHGRRFTGCLAQNLAANGFVLAIGPDAGAVAAETFDVIVVERDHVDPQGIVDELRRYFPETRMVSLVTVGAVMIAQAFTGIPRATDLERLRILAAAIRRAIANAAAGIAAAQAS